MLVPSKTVYSVLSNQKRTPAPFGSALHGIVLGVDRRLQLDTQAYVPLDGFCEP